MGKVIKISSIILILMLTGCGVDYKQLTAVYEECEQQSRHTHIILYNTVFKATCGELKDV